MLFYQSAKASLILTIVAMALLMTLAYSFETPSRFYRQHNMQLRHDEFVVQTKSPRYYYNQAERKGKCSLSGMCDGMRKCTDKGRCVGIDRPPKSENYYMDESIINSRCPSQGDFNYAIKDYFCNALRVCNNGVCQGRERRSE